MQNIPKHGKRQKIINPEVNNNRIRTQHQNRSPHQQITRLQETIFQHGHLRRSPTDHQITVFPRNSCSSLREFRDGEELG